MWTILVDIINRYLQSCEFPCLWLLQLFPLTNIVFNQSHRSIEAIMQVCLALIVSTIHMHEHCLHWFSLINHVIMWASLSITIVITIDCAIVQRDLHCNQTSNHRIVIMIDHATVHHNLHYNQTSDCWSWLSSWSILKHRCTHALMHIALPLIGLLICMDLCNWIACLQSSLRSTYSFAIIIMIETDRSCEHRHNRTCLLFQHDGHHDWTEQYFFHCLAMDSLILVQRLLLGWLGHSCATNFSSLLEHNWLFEVC